jgi:hypothetical protein
MRIRFLLFCLLFSCVLSADDETSNDEDPNSEEDTTWVEVLDFADLKLSNAAYGVSWGDSLDQVSREIRNGYSIQNAPKFFNGSGEEFFPSWKSSLESGRKTERLGGWRKGLREFYVFSDKNSSECLVVQFYQRRLVKIYHQFSDETKFTLEQSLVTADEFLTLQDRSLIGSVRSLGNDYRFLPDILRPNKVGEINSNVTIGSFLLKSIYGINWGSTPEVVKGSALARSWAPALPSDISGYATGKFPSLKAATVAPQVEPNATEAGSWTYYF